MAITPPTDQRLGKRFGNINDFWRWAFSDLRQNNVRGIFAEWVVAQILGLQIEHRQSWDNSDLVLPDGRTVEVKCSAYVQAWHHHDSKPSVIQFSGLKGRRWIDADQKRAAGAGTYNADVYVFCVQTHRDALEWDAFDLSQWEFYVVTRQALVEIGANSLRLSTIQNLASSVDADGLVAAVGI
jgi:hypothetical protein